VPALDLVRVGVAALIALDPMAALEAFEAEGGAW
jgi:hypothetical protein